MRAWLVDLLVRLAERLKRPILPPKPHLYRDAARPLITAVDAYDMSGEAKRHQVYAALLKQFPTARKRDLALAIELVMQEHP